MKRDSDPIRSVPAVAMTMSDAAIAVTRPISRDRPSPTIRRWATIDARPITASVTAMPRAIATTPMIPAQITPSAIDSRITISAPAHGAMPAAVSSSQPARVRRARTG